MKNCFVISTMLYIVVKFLIVYSLFKKFNYLLGKNIVSVKLK